MSDDDKSRPVTREQAEEAVRTLLIWAGEDPKREGLLDTPKRVVKAYSDWFKGYDEDPAEYLRRTFKEVDGYDEMIELHSRLEAAFAPLGIRGEGRRYRPHLTLGRIRQSDTGMIELREQLAAFEDYEAGIMTVSEVTIFHSDLRSTGPEYAALGHAELLG